MARAPQGFKVRLAPQDEFPHVPDAAANYNESMYFNMFDPAQKVGGWFRIGNRPNEGYAEISVCLYLPGGRVGFMFGRPKITGNAEMNAGGLKVEVVEPFKRLRVTYEGKVLLLDRPGEMAHPSKAFRDNPQLPCKVELDYEGVSPMFGGETVKEDGSALEIDPEKSFAKAHYEQHMAARGRFTVGEETFEVSGHGLRDKSWGPRHWQAINWYRWCPMNFGPDFAMMISLVADDQGHVRQGGMVLKDGVYDLITEAAIESDWDGDGYQTALRSRIKTRVRRAVCRRGRGAVADPAAQSPHHARRPGADHADHRGDDRVPLRRQGRLRPVGIPRPDRRRPTDRGGLSGGLCRLTI